MPATDYIDDNGVWIKLLGEIINHARCDAVGLRKAKLLNPNGTITQLARAHLGRRYCCGKAVKSLDYFTVHEVEDLGSFIYSGGVDRFLAHVGMPAIGETVVRQVEAEVAGRPLSLRRLK